MLMTKISEDNESEIWIKGGIKNLIDLIKDFNLSNEDEITSIINDAILTASQNFNNETNEILSDVLEISSNNNKPTLISCLIIINALLLQSRLRSSSKKKELRKNLRTLNELQNTNNVIGEILIDWHEIQKIDYRPIIDPAIKIINNLPTNKSINDAVKILLKSAIDTQLLVVNVQLDYLGGIYHKLLETARHDGSFYTTIEASILLSTIAIKKEHTEKIGGGYSRLLIQPVERELF